MPGMEFLLALMQLMMLNIVLSGDNAVVIALAAHGLPAKQQKQAILWGGCGVLIVRIALTFVATELLRVPFVQFVGALLLIWIAVNLLIGEDKAEAPRHAHGNLFDAVKTILVADVVMSLDNTLAIAGLAKGDWTLLIVGLTLSIPLIVFCSTLIMKMIERFPVIVYIGASLIAYTAGEMIGSDAAVHPYLPRVFHDAPYLGLLLVAGVTACGGWYDTAKKRTPRDVPVTDKHAAERLEDRID